MASFGYNIAKYKLATGALNLATADVRVLLVKQFNTANPDHATVAAVVDGVNNIECNFTNYARKTTAGKAVTQNDAADRAEADESDYVWTSAGGALNNAVLGLLRYVHVTDDSDSFPIGFHDLADTTTDGTDLTIQVGTNGAVHVT